MEDVFELYFNDVNGRRHVIITGKKDGVMVVKVDNDSTVPLDGVLDKAEKEIEKLEAELRLQKKVFSILEAM